MSTYATTSSVPREPSAYRPTVHFQERFRDKYDSYNRHLDGEVIEGCIRNGGVTQPSSNICYFEQAFGGVTYRLVVNTVRDVVITGHPVSIDPEAARESCRWSSRQIDEIREFLAAKPE